MKVRIRYTDKLDAQSTAAIFSFMRMFGGLKPDISNEPNVVEYSGLDHFYANQMEHTLGDLKDIDVHVEKEPQDYEPYILSGNNDDVRVTMAFKREANGDKVLSMQITTVKEPIEVVGELMIPLDYGMLDELRHWINEVII